MNTDMQFVNDFLISEYDFSPENIDVSIIKAGVENTNFFIKTPQEKFVFRIYNLEHSIRGARNIEQIELELSFSQKAHSYQIKTPLVIKNKQGSDIGSIDFNGDKHFCVLIEFIEGKSPTEYSKTIATEFGLTVNKLFTVGGLFADNGILGSGNAITDRGFAKYESYQASIDGEADMRVVELNNSLRKEFDRIKNQSPSLGLVHGDIKLENTLFDNDKLVALLDFDDFRFSYLLEEPVMTLMHNLHSKTENLIRSGNYGAFIKQLTNEQLLKELPDLKFFLQVRFLYDVCKNLGAGKKELVDELWEDQMIKDCIF